MQMVDREEGPQAEQQLPVWQETLLNDLDSLQKYFPSLEKRTLLSFEGMLLSFKKNTFSQISTSF